MYPQKITQHQAKIFLGISIVITTVAIGLAFAAVRFTSYYVIISGLVVGLSVGAGFLFSDGIF